MKRVMNHSSNCKKFDGNTEQALKKKFMDIKNRTENVLKNPNYTYHVKTIKELIEATFWVFSVLF